MIERNRCRSRSRISASFREQVAGAELEVLEVERGLAVLRVRVRRREGREQLLQKLAVPRGELLERRRDDRVARLARRSPREARAPSARRARGAARAASTRRAASRAAWAASRWSSVALGRRRRGSRPPRGAVDALVEAGAGARLEDELSTRRAERRVDLDEHPAEAVGAVGREELPPVGLVRGAERLERGRERLGLEDERLRLVEHAEARVDARRERVRARGAAGRSRGSSRPTRRRARARGRAAPAR